jgi:hypothetical protein
MNDPVVDPVLEAAMAFGESIAKAHQEQGGDLNDLFAAFVGIIVQEDEALGLYCLEKLDDWRTVLLSRARSR